MDSIIQAAGRCNRNKENPTLQSVFVVDVQDEKLSRLPDIEDGKDITARVFREKQGDNLLSDDVIGQFYNYYFYAQKDKMDCSVMGGKTTVYSLLSDNPFGTVERSIHQLAGFNLQGIGQFFQCGRPVVGFQPFHLGQGRLGDPGPVGNFFLGQAKMFTPRF